MSDDLKDVCNVLAFLFSAATYVFYLKAILDKEPTTLSTWFSWLFMDAAVLAGQIHEHKVSYQLVAYAIGCVAVLATAWHIKAPLRWTWVDTFCVAMVLGAAGLWSQTGDVASATLIELAAMTIASAPLFMHFWQSAEPIRAWPWVLNFVGAAFAIPAIKHWDVVGAASPLTFFVLSVVFNFAVLRTQRLRPIGINTPIGKIIDQLRR